MHYVQLSNPLWLISEVSHMILSIYRSDTFKSITVHLL